MYESVKKSLEKSKNVLEEKRKIVEQNLIHSRAINSVNVKKCQPSTDELNQLQMSAIRTHHISSTQEKKWKHQSNCRT